MRFALVSLEGRRVHGFQSPEGAEARFELRNVSLVDSATYHCIYVDMAPPFAGSAPSASLELRVDGEWTEPCPSGPAQLFRTFSYPVHSEVPAFPWYQSEVL